MRPKELDRLFQPLRVGNMMLKNRLIMAPMGTRFADKEGNVTERMLAYYAARGRGGAALITTEATSVDYPAGYLGPFGLRVDTDAHVAGLSRLARAIQAGGARASLQLVHAGRYSRSKLTGVQSVAPSAIASKYTGEMPRELTTAEVEHIIEEFAEGARRARDAGFDAIELMAASGYLLSQFISGLTNKRQDRFGGATAAERLTFPVEVVRAVRSKVGADFPVSFKLSVDEHLPGGNTVADSQVVAQKVVAAGASVVHAWSGWHESPIAMLPMSVPRGAFVPLAEAMKKVVSVPVVAVGRINDVLLAGRIIGEGKADLVAMGRALLADPELPRKAEEGRLSEIRWCIACCKCFDNLLLPLSEGKGHGSITCAVNAEAGAEWENKVSPASSPKRVLVVGGGPGGMEAARVAAARGHKVTLWERGNRLGGTALLAMIPPHKEEIQGIIDYLSHQMKLLKVDVRLGKEATAQAVLEGKFDEVVLATGGQPIVPGLPGATAMMTALDVLRGRQTGNSVVIIGGGMVGCETAEHLVSKGKKVTIVEMLERVASDVGMSSRWVLVKRLRDSGVGMLTKSKLVGIEDGKAIVESDGKRQAIAADSIILAVGMRPDTSLYEALKGRCKDLHMVGDCVTCKMINEAIHSGWEVGRTV